MLTVAYIDAARELGGAEKSLLELIGQMDRERVRPILLHPEDAVWLRGAELPGVERHSIFPDARVLGHRRQQIADGAPPGPAEMGQALRLVARVRAEVKRARAQVVHTNTLKAHLIGGLAARLAGVPLVWHVRDILPEGRGRRLLLAAARLLKPRIIAISHAVAAQFAGSSASVTVIHNGIPLHRFTPGAPDEQLRAELGLRPGVPTVGTVGRLTPWKGHPELLEALALVRDRGVDFQAVIVGEVAFWSADYAPELRAKCSGLGLDDRVVWSGFRDDIPEVLRLCDLFALPSHDEPFGRAIVEAMAIGLPVVACRSGGVPEIVVEGETGLLVEKARPDQLAQALAQLLTEQQTATDMGAAGRRRALELFDVRRVAQQVLDLYTIATE
jgi:glycosyltransferase involved in cell wall biosynthesis